MKDQLISILSSFNIIKILGDNLYSSNCYIKFDKTIKLNENREISIAIGKRNMAMTHLIQALLPLIIYLDFDIIYKFEGHPNVRNAPTLYWYITKFIPMLESIYYIKLKIYIIKDNDEIIINNDNISINKKNIIINEDIDITNEILYIQKESFNLPNNNINININNLNVLDDDKNYLKDQEHLTDQLLMISILIGFINGIKSNFIMSKAIRNCQHVKSLLLLIEEFNNGNDLDNYINKIKVEEEMEEDNENIKLSISKLRITNNNTN